QSQALDLDPEDASRAAEVYPQSTQRKTFCNVTLVCPMNWKNLSWAIRRSPQLNKRHRAEGVFLAGVKFSVQRLRIVRIAERNCGDIGARNAANRQSIIAALSGMSLPIYSMSF